MIKGHVFLDEDLVVDSKITSSRYIYLDAPSISEKFIFNRGDVIAMAKHFKLTEADLND